MFQPLRDGVDLGKQALIRGINAPIRSEWCDAVVGGLKLRIDEIEVMA